MTSADHILKQIDNALEDWTVGPDGMRSRPATGAPSIGFHIEPPAIDPALQQRWQEMQEHFRRLHLERAGRVQAAFNEAMTAMAEAVKPAAEAATRGLAELAKALERSTSSGQRNYRHLPEAIGCNDCSKPAPRRGRAAQQSPYGPAQKMR